MAMIYDESELVGGENFVSLAEALRPKPPKRGRPYLIDDDALIQRGEELLGTFENHWAEFAWELTRARTLAQVRSALRLIGERSGLEPFISEPIQTTTWAQLRETRKLEDWLNTRLRKVIHDERRAKERLENVVGALRDSPEDEQLSRLCAQRRNAHDLEAQYMESLNRQIEECRDSIRKQEAYVAQSELLDFITSKRYVLNPLAFANAMAGLPFVTWRQSARRCAKTKAGHRFGITYEKFRELERALSRPPRTASAAILRMKTHLLKSKRQRDLTIRTFREKWFHLRLSIESAYQVKVPMSAILHRIFAEYERRTSSVSRRESVLEEEERL